MSNSDPNSSQVRVDRATFESLDRQTEATGLKKVEFLSRLMGWYEQQQPTVQQAIIARQDANEEIWRLRHQEKLGRGEKYAATAGMDITTALRQIRELAERVEILHRAAVPPKKGK